MRTDKEIQERIDWTIKALKDEDNQSDRVQAQLYAQLDILKWAMSEKTVERMIIQTLNDFRIEYGTIQYDNLLKNAKELGINTEKWE